MLKNTLLKGIKVFTMLVQNVDFGEIMVVEARACVAQNCGFCINLVTELPDMTPLRISSDGHWI